MYNSFVVRYLAKLWGFITINYDGSLIKRFFDGVKRIVEYIFKGSIIKEIFTSRDSIIEKSIFYRIYSFKVDLASKVLKSSNQYINKISENSGVSKNARSLFKNDKEIIRTMIVFLLFFGAGIIGINFTKGYLLDTSTILALFLVIFSLISLAGLENYSNILDNSFIIGVIKGIFTVDEGGNNWW